MLNLIFVLFEHTLDHSKYNNNTCDILFDKSVIIFLPSSTLSDNINAFPFLNKAFILFGSD